MLARAVDDFQVGYRVDFPRGGAPGPADETQVMAQLDKVLNAEREVQRTQIALMVRIKNKLTPEQQARLRHLRGKPPR